MFLARLASKWEPARVTYISQTLYRGVVAGYIFVQGIQNWPVQPNLPARNRAKKNVDPTGNYQLIRLVNSVALYVKRAHLQLKRKTNDFPFSSLLIAWGSNLIWLWYCEELLWFITNAMHNIMICIWQVIIQYTYPSPQFQQCTLSCWFIYRVSHKKRPFFKI